MKTDEAPPDTITTNERMKVKHKKPEPARTAVIELVQDSRFKDSPRQAAMVDKMAAALERRKRKTSWISDVVRADMLRRYANVLDDPSEIAQRDFVRWAVDDGHYLGVEGNFAEFCRVYLLAEPPDVTMLWEMAAEAPH